MSDVKQNNPNKEKIDLLQSQIIQQINYINMLVKKNTPINILNNELIVLVSLKSRLNSLK
jgi:hypothetical protein